MPINIANWTSLRAHPSIAPRAADIVYSGAAEVTPGRLIDSAAPTIASSAFRDVAIVDAHSALFGAVEDSGSIAHTAPAIAYQPPVAFDFNGSDGDDIYNGDGTDEIIKGNGGNDTLYGNGGNDRIEGNAGADYIEGSDGDDVLSSESIDPNFVAFIVSPGVSLDTFSEIDTLIGGAGDDYIFAGYLDNVDGGAQGSYGNRLYISFLAAPHGIQADFRPLNSQSSINIDGGVISNITNIGYIEGSNFDDFLVPIDTYYPAEGSVYGRGGNDNIIANFL